MDAKGHEWLQVLSLYPQPSASASEGREARIRELSEQVQNGTYRVPAAHIAGKLLLDTLCEQLV